MNIDVSGPILSIAAYARGVSLCFLHGAKLPDPEKRLRGSGKQVRHIKLPTAATLEDPAVQAPIASALQHASSHQSQRSMKHKDAETQSRSELQPSSPGITQFVILVSRRRFQSLASQKVTADFADGADSPWYSCLYPQYPRYSRSKMFCSWPWLRLRRAVSLAFVVRPFFADENQPKNL